MLNPKAVNPSDWSANSRAQGNSTPPRRRPDPDFREYFRGCTNVPAATPDPHDNLAGQGLAGRSLSLGPQSAGSVCRGLERAEDQPSELDPRAQRGASDGVGARSAEAEPARDAESERDLLLNDPLARALAWSSPSPSASTAAAPGNSPIGVALHQSAQLDQLAVQWVRRLSVGNNGRHASVRLEVGEGPYAGIAVLVSSERGQVSVRVQADADVDAGPLVQGIRARLSQRGVDAADVCLD